VTRILAAAGLLTVAAAVAATLYGIAMYRELQRPASWMEIQEAGA
jgi:hypothetical protein